MFVEPNLEKNGRVDPLLEQQVNRISSEIQDLTDVKQGLERIQTQLNRPGFEFHRDTFDPLAEKKKAAVEKYLRKGEAAMAPESRWNSRSTAFPARFRISPM